MDSTKIPVTLDFFKKYTFHEEWIDVMFKAKAKGNQKIYNELCNNPESKEKALKAYYEAFYLKPNIREKFHIRLKPVPKKIKDKLLQIPVQNNSSQTTEIGKIAQQDSRRQELLAEKLQKSTKCSNEGVVSNVNKKDTQNKSLLLQEANYEEHNVEDDSQRKFKVAVL